MTLYDCGGNDDYDWMLMLVMTITMITTTKMMMTVMMMMVVVVVVMTLRAMTRQQPFTNFNSSFILITFFNFSLLIWDIQVLAR